MIVGVPREIKLDEYRVGMLPVGVEEFVLAGHTVLVEAGAGQGSGLSDHDYLRQGAKLVASGRDLYERAEMVVKVKEPQAEEIPFIRPGQILFTYFHFAADRDLTDAMLESGATCVAYETLRDERGQLPLSDADERGRGSNEHSGGGEVSGTSSNGGEASCWVACQVLPQRALPFSVAVL